MDKIKTKNYNPYSSHKPRVAEFGGIDYDLENVLRAKNYRHQLLDKLSSVLKDVDMNVVSEEIGSMHNSKWGAWKEALKSSVFMRVPVCHYTSWSSIMVIGEQLLAEPGLLLRDHKGIVTNETNRYYNFY